MKQAKPSKFGENSYELTAYVCGDHDHEILFNLKSSDLCCFCFSYNYFIKISLTARARVPKL